MVLECSIQASVSETNRMAKNIALVADIKMRWFAKPVLFVLCIFRIDAPMWLVRNIFSVKVRSVEKHC